MTSKKSGCGCLSTILLGTALLIVGSYALSKDWHQFFWGTELTPLEAAEIIPQDIVITSYINTNPENWSELQVPEVDRLMTQASQEFKQSLPPSFDNFNYQQDIRPWLGNAAIAWFPKIEPSRKNGYQIKPDADFLLIFGIKDPLKAYQFRQQIKSSSKILATESKFQGVTIMTYEQSPTAKLYVAVLRNKLVVTEKLSIMHRAIATFQGEPALASNPEYKKVLRQKLDLKNPLVQVHVTNYQSSSEPIFPVDAVALAIGSEAKAIRLKTIANLNQNIDWQPENSNQELVLKNFPESTVALLGGQINAQEISHTWSYFIEDYYPYLAWCLDSEYDLSQWLTAISNYQDLLQLIDGEFALGIALDEAIADPDNLSLDFGAGLIVTMSDRSAAETALKRLKSQSILNLLLPGGDLKGQLYSAYFGLSSQWLAQDNLLLTWNNNSERIVFNQPNNSILDNPRFAWFYQELSRKNLGYFFLDVDAITSGTNNLFQLQELDSSLTLVNSIESISSYSILKQRNKAIESDIWLRFK
ncbi:MAG: DUF3352 domain-containing protein [Cyanobacteria bacterium P01_E01_bin.35]